MDLEPAIERAERRIEYLSGDEETMDTYWERERSLHERANMINSAEQRKTIEIAINFLDIADDETIAIKTGLDISTVKKLREEYN